MSYGEQVTATTPSGNTVMLQLDVLPDMCPMCHHSMEPQRIGFYAIGDDVKRVRGIFKCPRKVCQEVFIGSYYRYDGPDQRYKLIHLAPSRPLPVTVPEEIAKISPTYVEIRNQAAAAEALKLNQLVGMGLRKALEFLVKDFAISEHPGEAENIKKMLLGPCIEKYLPDGNIKACAKRATWLGNDETHYIRKWEDHDVNDLKELIRLTINWIDSHLATKRFVGGMPEGKP